MAVVGIHCADWCAGEPVQTRGPRGVVRMPVSDQDQFDDAGTGQCLQVRFIVGSWVNHHDGGLAGGAQEIGVGAVQTHGARIGGKEELRKRAAPLQDRAGMESH